MDSNRTLLAVMLSMVVMMGFFVVQATFFPPEEAPPPEPPRHAQDRDAGLFREDVPPVITDPAADIWAAITPDTYGEAAAPQTVVVQTDLIRVVLSNVGGEIISFQLMQHMDGREPVEMIFSGDARPQGFAVAFGNWEDVLDRRIRPVDLTFHVRQPTRYIVEFYRDFQTAAGEHFTMLKRYDFRPGEYMFQLTIGLNGGDSKRAFNFGGAAYTLVFGPQIGPKFERLDGRHEYRRFNTFRGGRLSNERVRDGQSTVITNNPNWAAIVGKYFSLVAMPLMSQFEIAFSTQSEPGLPAASRLLISRPPSLSPRVEDTFLFYFGPNRLEVLRAYERGENSFMLSDTGLAELADTRGFLAPLERILKWCLQFFYTLIPNYGVAIILLTLLVRVVMFPLTKKGSMATLRMQALAPKIKELQEKYKDNRQKLNAEMAEFYKREGYNPIAGCLPLLIQLPIFIAMFNLFNTHFDLRGAMFIPGWIPDLSVPEYIYAFPEGVTIPLLGWTALRLLPFIYVGSQMLYSVVTLTPDQKGNPHMKLMLYAMPVIFFFVLYNMPSGLLVYWISSNILTMVQQVGINKWMARKKAAEAAAGLTKAGDSTSADASNSSISNSPRKKKKK